MTTLTVTWTVSELLDLYEADVLPHQAPSTQRSKHNLYERLRRELGEVLLTELTPALLRQWRDRWAVGRGTGTMATYMQAFSAVLTVAVQEYEVLPENPLRKVRRPPMPHGRVRFLDADEQRRLLDACQRCRDPKLYPFVLLALTTGARKTEMLLLRWTDLDLAQGLMRLEKTKTGLARVVPVPTMTVPVLRAWAVTNPGPWVFPGVRGAIPANLNRQWVTLCQQAQLANFHIHDLRHTAASYMAQSGMRIEDIADVLGHRSTQTTRIYRHLTPSYTAGLLENMTQQFVQPAPTREE